MGKRVIPEQGQIAWADRPASARTPWYPIYRPSPGNPCLLIMLDGELHGVNVHSTKKRDTPCTGDPRTCIEYCKRRTLRWKGYFAAYDTISCRCCIAEVTTQAWEEWLALPEPKVKPWRCHRIITKRLGDRENAPCSVEFAITPLMPNEVPAVFCVKSALRRIWEGETKGPDTPEE